MRIVVELGMRWLAAEANVFVATVVTNVTAIAADNFQDIAMLPLRPEWSDRFDGQRIEFSECLREKSAMRT
jgi:hypothetical protein